MEPRWTAAAVLGVFGLAVGWLSVMDRAPTPACPGVAVEVECAPRASEPAPAAPPTAAFGEEFAKDLTSRLAASDATCETEDLAGPGYRIVAVTYGSITSQDSVTVGDAVHGAVDAIRARTPTLADCSQWRFDSTTKETIHLACVRDTSDPASPEADRRVSQILAEFTAARSPKDHLPGQACQGTGDCVAGSICLEARVLPACDGDNCCSPQCRTDADCAAYPGTVCPIPAGDDGRDFPFAVCGSPSDG